MSRSEKKTKSFVVIIAVIVCLVTSAVHAGTVWYQHQKLFGSEGASQANFGGAVYISGDYAIVGAREDDEKGTNFGAAYIFAPNDVDAHTWDLRTKLFADDGAFSDFFGGSVSISGNFAIVGATGDDDNGTRSGSAYIFAPNDVDPNKWDQRAKLVASDGDRSDEFGYSVSISGDYAIVGAIGDDDRGTRSGSAYIFAPNDVDSNKWDQRAKLLASDGNSGHQFGCSVSISGNLAIVGAQRESEAGSAYIFKKSEIPGDPNWYELCKVVSSDIDSSDYFGQSVSISGELVIIGAPADDDNGTDSGSAYIFAPNEINPNNWIQQQKILATTDGFDTSWFGGSVSISGDLAIVGAKNTVGDSGSAYIFKWEGVSWLQQQELRPSDLSGGYYFGGSVSISGDSPIVGAPGDDENGGDSGSAYIFARCYDWLTADLSSDCYVDFVDFAILGNQWFDIPSIPSADIAPNGGDNFVNYLDLGVLVEQWLKCGDPCDPSCVP